MWHYVQVPRGGLPWLLLAWLGAASAEGAAGQRVEGESCHGHNLGFLDKSSVGVGGNQAGNKVR